jgi:hypothetical protein
MALPFEIADKDKRKFQCFVCGVMFSEYKQYRDHIIEKHEEGREYIICPLEHCQAPVRDVAAHCKAKHPSFAVPKKGMMKSVIWKDFNPKAGPKPKTQKPKFRQGYYESTKMCTSLLYRSGYEATIYECLDCDADVTAFEVEPFEIEYIHKGKSHKYVPDIIVRFIDGHTELWEIKPSSQTLLEKNQDKWDAAKDACKVRGWTFEVITEIGIDKLKKKVQLQNAMAKAQLTGIHS